MATGPRTAKGKAASATNAVRHGLAAQRALLPDEDSGALEDLVASIQEQLEPEGAIERALVEIIALKIWRLRRVARAETVALKWTWHQGQLASARDRAADARLAAIEVLPEFRLEPPDAQLEAQAEVTRARVEALKAVEVEQEDAVGMSAWAMQRDAAGPDALSTLCRYETTLERGLIRILHEFERLQAGRVEEAGDTFVSQKE